ncbi:hypothetical protein [Amycolatopsis aidingensis]|uniref:hypothetical protein n=1 Tax=Amycolatopsis aidingensis TaxID=2842453 RepID=UPI001C0B68E2|nr:hypothetical protein [Amycolatopsis aidingensis]
MVLAAAVALTGLVLAARWAREGHGLAGLTLCGLTATAVSPFSWSHHWVWLGPLAVLAVLHASRAQAVTLGLLTFAWPVHILFGMDIHFPVLGISMLPGWHGLEALYGNAYLLVFAGTLLVARKALR